MMNYASVKIDSPWNFSSSALEVEGGPSWFDSDRYTVEAVVERFHLKTHREEREVPIYELTMAPGGLKLQRDGDRSCTEPDAGGPTRDEQRQTVYDRRRVFDIGFYWRSGRSSGHYLQREYTASTECAHQICGFRGMPISVPN